MNQKHIAVTGTKGKTTVTRLIQEVLVKQGNKVFGEYGIDGSYLNGKPLTEEFRSADDYFSNKEMMDSNIIVSEATSYILEGDLYENNKIDIAIFTGFEENEHSELYEDPDAYLAAKRRIFGFIKDGGSAIVNRDSPFFEKIVEDLECKIYTYGFSEKSDYNLTTLLTCIEGSKFEIKCPDNDIIESETALWGDFNISNMGAAFVACSLAGFDSNDIVSSFREFPGIKGRSNVYQVIETNTLVIIDYAHTPQSLKNQLGFLNDNKGSRKIVTVFGCGGGKSESKRPEMGFVAGHLSDHIILTNDNPRGEHPRQIIMDILEGVHNLGSVETYPDREEAIKRALSSFNDSIILIAGKGAEKYLEILDYEIPMCDTEIFEKWALQNGYGIRGFRDYID